jgi:quercetin dioxygenase-like cupin family protein
MKRRDTLKGKALTAKDQVCLSARSIVSRTLVNRKAGTITLFAFDKGQSLSEHTAPFDAFVAVIEGEGQFSIGRHSVRVRAGQFIIMPAGVPHAVRARRQFKMLLVMIRS